MLQIEIVGKLHYSTAQAVKQTLQRYHLTSYLPKQLPNSLTSSRLAKTRAVEAVLTPVLYTAQ